MEKKIKIQVKTRIFLNTALRTTVLTLPMEVTGFQENSVNENYNDVV
jgi:hypothetical protein